MTCEDVRCGKRGPLTDDIGHWVTLPTGERFCGEEHLKAFDVSEPSKVSPEIRKDTAQISARIRKLLSLSTSENPHEAASAAARAQALMQEHKLTEVDVSASAGEGENVTEIAMGAEGFMADWKFALVTHVARAFFCEAIGLRVKKRRKVRIIGRREDAQTAVEVFSFLVKEIERLSKDVTPDGDARVLSPTVDLRDFLKGVFGTPDVRVYREQWRQGAACGAADKLKAQMTTFAASSENALLVVKKSKDEIEKHLETKYPKTSQRQVNIHLTDDDAFDKGYAVGSEIKLSVAVPTSTDNGATNES